MPTEFSDTCLFPFRGSEWWVRFYNKGGMAGKWIKEGKQAVAMPRLSCHCFQPKQVRLWLRLIAYNLGKL